MSSSTTQTVPGVRRHPADLRRGLLHGQRREWSTRCAAPDLIEHQFGTAGVGAEAVQHVKASIRDVHGAFPDITFTIEDAVESGDTIWVRVRGRGTATGPLLRPPERQTRRHHRDRRRAGREWAHRRALGRPRPVRGSRADRRPGEAGVTRPAALNSR